MIVKITNNGDIQTHDIDKDIVTIGRSRGADIQIESKFVSRKHLEISKNYNGDFFIKDISGNNWVSYNNEQIEKKLEIQYFAFAVLLLPGDYIVEISNTLEDLSEKKSNETSAFDHHTSSTSYTGKTDSALTEIDKKMEEKILLATLNTGMSGNSSSSNPRKKIYIISGLMILGLVGLMVFTTKPQPKPLENKNDIVKDPKNKPISRPVSRPQPPPRRNETQVKTDYDLYLTMRPKFNCASSNTKVLCSRILYNIGPQEGLFFENQTLYIVKDKSQRLEMMYKGQSKIISQLKGLGAINKIIVGEKVLLPQLMEELEKKKIYSVKVLLVSGSGKYMKIVGRYSIETSYYRRYESSDYQRAYDQVISKLNLSDFQANFSKYISEE